MRPETRAGHPEPLIYYLHAATLAHSQAIAAAHGSDLPGSETDLHDLLSKTNFWDVAGASGARLSEMLSGLNKWRDHPYHRQMADPPTIWAGGGATLHDYSQSDRGPRVLVVPSLINKADILDLSLDASFLRYLAANGLRPALLKWGDPTLPGSPQTVDDYVKFVIAPAYEHLASGSKNPPGIIGYCVGGTLALGFVAGQKRDIPKLALIGAPWNFENLQGVSQALKTYTQETGPNIIRHHLNAIGQSFGAIPASVFQQLFAVLSPMQMVQKFTSFDRLDLESAAAKKFIAVEDWLADGVPVSTAAAETILIDWYVENSTATGNWRLLGNLVEPKNLKSETLIIAGKKDHIVPPPLSRQLAEEITNAKLISVDMGHVGMIIGSQSRKKVADPLIEFYSA